MILKKKKKKPNFPECCCMICTVGYVYKNPRVTLFRDLLYSAPAQLFFDNRLINSLTSKTGGFYVTFVSVCLT